LNTFLFENYLAYYFDGARFGFFSLWVCVGQNTVAHAGFDLCRPVLRRSIQSAGKSSAREFFCSKAHLVSATVFTIDRERTLLLI
jgi:hypothetical protein